MNYTKTVIGLFEFEIAFKTSRLNGGTDVHATLKMSSFRGKSSNLSWATFEIVATNLEV